MDTSEQVPEKYSSVDNISPSSHDAIEQQPRILNFMSKDHEKREHLKPTQPLMEKQREVFKINGWKSDAFDAEKMVAIVGSGDWDSSIVTTCAAAIKGIASSLDDVQMWTMPSEEELAKENESQAGALAPIFPCEGFVDEKTVDEEKVDEDIVKELEQKWLLKLSMQYRDENHHMIGEEFLHIYNDALQPRRVTVSLNYRNASSESLENDLSQLRYQRDKSARIYEFIRNSLPNIQFYDTVTNLRLETRDDRLHVYVTEDSSAGWDVPWKRSRHSEHVLESSLLPEKPHQQLTPKDTLDGVGESPLNVNAKQFHRILKRRIARQQLEERIMIDREQNSVDRGHQHVSQSRNKGKRTGASLDVDPSTEAKSMVEDYDLMMMFSVLSEAFHRYSADPSRVTKIRQGLSGFANNQEISALADTGSPKNVISAAQAKRLGLEPTGSSCTFKFGDSRKASSIGRVSLRWAFAENPKKTISIVCHVMPTCNYDLILGSGFLQATEVFTKYRHRLTKCFFSILSNFAHFGFLGETTERLKGTLGDERDVFAVPDTGAERNVMDTEYALRHGLQIQRNEEYREYLQFADGTVQETVGRVNTYWTFENGKRIPISFEVLKNCCSDVIIGEEILMTYNVFEEQASSIVNIASESDEYYLAPFDFIRTWQRPLEKTSQKIRYDQAKSGCTKQSGNPEITLDTAHKREEQEQRRLDKWNYTYDFGATASTGEKELEKIRRARYASENGDHRQNGGPRRSHGSGAPSTDRQTARIPSIPTAHDR